MVDTNRLAVARVFVRSCNVLLKQAALYGLKHSRCAAQFENTWKDLRKAVEDGSKLALAVAGDKLMLDGAPLACGTAERSLAGFLAAAGIGRMVFYPAVCPDEFQEIIQIFSSTKPAEVLAKLRPELGKTIGNIRVHEFRMLDSSGDDGEGGGGTGGGDGISSGLDLGVLLSDPHKLLQLLGAADASSAGAPAETGEAAPGAGFHEHNVLGMIRWLTSFAGAESKDAATTAAAGIAGGFPGSGSPARDRQVREAPADSPAQDRPEVREAPADFPAQDRRSSGRSRRIPRLGIVRRPGRRFRRGLRHGRRRWRIAHRRLLGRGGRRLALRPAARLAKNPAAKTRQGAARSPAAPACRTGRLARGQRKVPAGRAERHRHPADAGAHEPGNRPAAPRPARTRTGDGPRRAYRRKQ